MREPPGYLPLILAVGALALLPFAMRAGGLTLTAATEVVIFAIAGMALNVLVGATGLVSFGHGAFFGLGGFVVALAQRDWFPGGIVAPALIAIAAAAAFALVAGSFILRLRGLYVALATLVLPGMLSAVAFYGAGLAETGLGVARAAVAGIDLADPWTFYATVAAVGFGVVYLLWRLHRSPFGHALVAIRENEQRARVIGYPAERCKLAAFTVSAALTALAGVLAAFLYGIASASEVSLTFSGELLAMVVVGGMRSFLGPAFGALVFVLFREFVSGWTANWLLCFSAVFVGFVLIAPDGVIGIVERLFARFGERRGKTAPTAPAAAAGHTPLPAAPLDRANSDLVLIARELTQSFGAFRAVANGEVVVTDRTLHALIGPNGAGKSTMLDLLSGMLPPQAGFITVAGQPLGGRGPTDFARAGVGRSFQVPSLFARLSVGENLRLAVQARHRGRLAAWASTAALDGVDAEAAAIAARLGFSGRERVQAALLPLAEQRLLDIGLALAGRPRILLLDEPFAGLAPDDRVRVGALVKAASAQIAVLVAERDLAAVETADAVTVMNDGAVVMRGSVDDARRKAGGHDTLARSAVRAPPSAAGATALLSVETVETFYGAGRVLNRVSFDVSENEIVALLGRNGAGKSTLLKTLMGIAPPRSGAIKLAGEDVARLPPAAVARRGVCYVPQDRGLFAGMTVAENLALGRLKRRDGNGTQWDDERIVWVFPRLAPRWYTPADRLSRGEQQMLAVARALAGNVRLLLLDEPFEGLPPIIAAELFEAFNRVRYEIAMVITDHGLDLALALSDRTVVLEGGVVSWSGPSRLLRDDPELRRRTLWT